jgi:hypothetical protein
MRQQAFDKVGLMRAQSVTLAAAEERTLRLPRAAVVRRCVVPRAIA